MEDMGIIEPSSAQYSLPLVCFTKKDGSVRLCLDARALNQILDNDRESPSQIDQVLQTFHLKKIYSTVDLSSGYWQIEIEEESRDYLSFVYNGRNMRFTRLAFGIRNAMALFIKCLRQAVEKTCATTAPLCGRWYNCICQQIRALSASGYYLQKASQMWNETEALKMYAILQASEILGAHHLADGLHKIKRN
ncbi:hypothetical protein LSTR_LSTR005157 [Laodelphax striatellus]|uniref:Reverse transcriptase domain-containing protein n=1 Tax=Laodelphax striatellus TaxID=195883 RepID=A0A482X0R5_LAOST|nr:hypothetical protein LSTR_LSTR005157 [Laodelphax striatellus]